MAWAWKQYLEFADKIHSLPSANESCHRSSISRSYYYAFHAAVDFVTPIASEPPSGTGEDHSWVIRMLFEHGPVHKDIAKCLQRMKPRRRSADYDAIYPGSVALESKQCIEDARKVQEYLSRLNPRPKP